MSPDINKLLCPKSVAIVGASPRQAAAATRVINNLKRFGYGGPIYPVNPRYPEVQGLRCYPSLGELPETPDAVFVAIAAESVMPVIEEAGRCGIRAAIVNASGFADSGPDGEALQARLLEAAQASGIAVCGPNNMGFINLHDRICMWTARVLPKLEPGPAAIISQSGSVAIAISQDDREIGFSYIITAGNEAVCTAADYLQAVIRDDRVRVVMMFIETIRNPRLFAEAALEAAARGKRIVVLKVGRSEGGRAAVAAHTGALSGEDRVYDAFFRRYGIVRAGDIDEMIETAILLKRYPDPPAPRKAIAITVSGGEAALIADIGAGAGLRLAELSPATIAAMKPAFPPFARPRNPVDAWGLGWDPERFQQIFDALIEEPDAGAIALAVDAPGGGGADAHVALDMAQSCIAALGRTDKRIVFLNNVAAGGVNLEVRKRLDDHGMPYLAGMRPALAAIAHWLSLEIPARIAAPAARALPVIERLAEPERFRLVAEAGIPMAECVSVRSAEDAVQAAKRLGFPVVLKGTSPHLAHKTEHGLVKLGLADGASVAAAYRELQAILERQAPQDSLARIIVQPMAGEGVQLLLGARNDPDFGSILVVGLGGTLVEVMGEASLRIGPVDAETAAAMLAETKAATLLAGTRGKGPFDADAAIAAIVAFSRFAHDARGCIVAAEINPLIVREKGAGAIGVDLVLEPLG
ncbi:MAG TPA: acetate--CoA ligase family protein [Alphaproteobacteria bacterium]|nr:acetate--CoA ligase family protein [Alphaproteobacteria bacterium]